VKPIKTATIADINAAIAATWTGGYLFADSLVENLKSKAMHYKKRHDKGEAGVDVNKIRKEFPKFLMMGGFDKMVLKEGAPAIRKEFERLLPAMKSGGFVPSMDHQTPPECSLENYRTYIRLFHEFAEKAAR
jgi:uroporphyrinogen-III decarboxylase